MNILAVNGSPKGKSGNTEQLLQSFLRGARSAGADVEVVYLKEKKIKHCIGCVSCWLKTPGICVHQDDMAELLEKSRQADVIVMATPLYKDTVSGLMKDFMDRSNPLLLPYIIKDGNNYFHPKRYENETPKKMVLISNCGFPERRFFFGMEETFRLQCSSHGDQPVGFIFCSCGEMLTQPQAQEHIQWYLSACEGAGREVVEQGGISSKTQAVLNRELITDIDMYLNMTNTFFKDQILAAEKKIRG